MTSTELVVTAPANACKFEGMAEKRCGALIVLSSSCKKSLAFPGKDDLTGSFIAMVAQILEANEECRGRWEVIMQRPAVKIG